LDAGTLNLKEIFSQDRRHVVPLFQRPYVWKKDEQWEPLWDDIRELAERVMTDGKSRPHFLGAIVLDQQNTTTGQIEMRLVIDGQQRLTTMQLLLEAFCDLCKELDADKHHRALLKLTRNDDPMSDEPDEKFKVWPTQVDQDTFRSVMNCESPTDLSTVFESEDGVTVDNPIANAYSFFYQMFSDWLQDSEQDTQVKIDALLIALREHLRFVVIDLEEDDDAQLIFETLNARGTPLLPSDLVKNYILHRADTENKKVEVLYNKYWKKFDSNASYWRRTTGRGHAKRHRLDIFLQHYLSLKTLDSVTTAHLYRVFQDYADSKDVEEVLVDVQRLSKVYRRISKADESYRGGMFVSRLTALDLTTAYPVLLYLFDRYSEDADLLNSIVEKIESFLIRRMVCQLNTRGYNTLFVEMLQTLAKNPDSPAEAVDQFLNSGDSESTRWPDDDEFRQAWSTVPVYRVLTRKRTKMLLAACELELRSGKSEQIELPTKLTIEHVLPSRWKKHWPVPDDVEDESEFEEQRDHIKHTIGNLTLVTGKLNPSISNKDWDSKRPALVKHSILRLNNELTERDVWNEDAIRHRADELFVLATRVWPR